MSYKENEMDSFRAAIPDSYKDEWQNPQNMQAHKHRSGELM